MNTQKNTQTTVDITMKLFNAVPKHGNGCCYSKGVFMMPGAQWAETKIRSYITRKYCLQKVVAETNKLLLRDLYDYWYNFLLMNERINVYEFR